MNILLSDLLIFLMDLAWILNTATMMGFLNLVLKMGDA